jgi:hypothetical protein
VPGKGERAVDRTYRPRKGWDDGIDRAGVGIFIDLAPNQVKTLEGLAEPTGKSLKLYLEDIAFAMIDQIVPAKKD